MKVIEVAAAIIQKEKQVFATCRGYGSLKGKWEFPGGKIEAGETPEDALMREIKEELGISVSISSHFQTLTYDYPDFRVCLHCYLCTLTDSDPVLLEHQNACWADAG